LKLGIFPRCWVMSRGGRRYPDSTFGDVQSAGCLTARVPIIRGMGRSPFARMNSLKARTRVRAWKTSTPSRRTWCFAGSTLLTERGDQNFGPQPPCLLESSAGEFVAGYAARKAEVILDPRRRSGLSAGRLSLNHDSAKSFGCPVDRRGEASRSTTDNRNIELGGSRRSLEPKTACKIPHFEFFDYGTVGQSRHRTIGSRTLPCIQKSHRFWRVRRCPIRM
jgi:hypothetical protein